MVELYCRFYLAPSRPKLIDFQRFQSDANFPRLLDDRILVDPPERLSLLDALATLSPLPIIALDELLATFTGA